MTTLTIEVPEALVHELDNRQIPRKLVDSIVVRTIELLLQTSPAMSNAIEDDSDSPFVESAVSFVEQLLDENFELFDRLAKL